jgi:pimeloyl-ACP methyl ester carboxylesterase
MKYLDLLFILAVFSLLNSCNEDKESTRACDAEPEILTTSAGVEFVRTPNSCFEGLPDWPYEVHYVEIDGLRQAYVDEGPSDGPVVLLLHGQPSWSYLYRKMIPVLADAGMRVIAMDHLGMGRSDKPINIADYSYLGHNDRLLRFIDTLELNDITIFVQDWGSLIGLRVAGLNPNRFARIAVGDGALPVWPEGFQPFPPVENPNETIEITSPFDAMPEQQVSFYNGCESLSGPDDGYFGDWMAYAMKAESFHASEVVEAMTWFDLPADEEAAYDAPFPSRIYMAGPRVFPSLANEVPGTTQEAWAGLMAFQKPLVTIWAANDPGNLGSCQMQNNLACYTAGAQGQPHARLAEASHFLQDDQGAEIGRRLVAWMTNDTSVASNYTPACELPITPNGTGTVCIDDDGCSDLGADTCLTTGTAGFCTVEGCVAGSCEGEYVCCHDCNPMAEDFLPFDGSACFPFLLTAQLTGQAGCTCN